MPCAWGRAYLSRRCRLNGKRMSEASATDFNSYATRARICLSFVDCVFRARCEGVLRVWISWLSVNALRSMTIGHDLCFSVFIGGRSRSSRHRAPLRKWPQINPDRHRPREPGSSGSVGRKLFLVAPKFQSVERAPTAHRFVAVDGWMRHVRPMNVDQRSPTACLDLRVLS